MTISEANMKEAERLADLIRKEIGIQIFRQGEEYISDALQARDDAHAEEIIKAEDRGYNRGAQLFEQGRKQGVHDCYDAAQNTRTTPTVDVDKLAEEVSFKLLAEVHHDGYFASHDEGSTFISIIKTALLKARCEV